MIESTENDVTLIIKDYINNCKKKYCILNITLNTIAIGRKSKRQRRKEFF